MVAVDILGEQYFYLKIHLEELAEKCTKQEDLDALAESYKTSRKNFNKAINRIFDENTEEFKSLKDKLEENMEAIKQSLKDEEKIVKILDTIAAGVDFGSSLVRLA